MDAPGNDGNAAMPEKVKLPNSWKMMMILVSVLSTDLRWQWSLLLASEQLKFQLSSTPCQFKEEKKTAGCTEPLSFLAVQKYSESAAFISKLSRCCLSVE